MKWAVIVFVLLSEVSWSATDSSTHTTETLERITGQTQEEPNMDAAIRAIEESLRTAEVPRGAKNSGVRHDTKKLADALTQTYMILGYDAARQVFMRVMAFREEQHKVDSDELMPALNVLADFSDKLGMNSEAQGYRERISMIRLGPRAAAYRKALEMEARQQYLSALTELGTIIKSPPAGGLFYARDDMEDSGNIVVKRAMARMLKKAPFPSALPAEARKHVARAEVWLNKKTAENAELQLAAFEYHEAIRAATYAPALYYNAALIHGRLAQYEQAIDRMWMYLDLVPEATDAATASENIRQWEILLRQKRANAKEKPQ